ncbi:MAG TPA: nucleotidyltransferase family protein [Planctomycetota bacterium]|nr:nucleotidyltransferase family protein [Planctomycetota bacterium]
MSASSPSADDAALQFTPEFELLRRCAARVCGQPLPFENVAALDPARVIRTAQRHRLIPLLRKFFFEIPGSEALTLPLESAYASSLKASLVLTAAMLELHEKFAVAGISAVPVKGPALAAQIYEGEFLRGFDDIDFFIPEASFVPAHQVLLRAGYVPMFELTRGQWRRFTRYFDEVAYRHPDTDAEVDLQWRACSPAYSFAPDCSKWFGRLGKITISGREVPALHPDDLLEFLLIHGSKHGWARLSWLMDLARIIASMPRERLSEWLNLPGCRKMRATAAALASKVIGLPAQSSSDAAAPLVERIIEGMQSGPRELANYDLFPKLMDADADRKRYRYETTLRPTPWEWQLLPLPGVLSPLYFVLRPLRIVAKRVTPNPQF